MSFTEENRQDLQEKGYTVVTGVLTEDECQELIGLYKEWLATNFKEGEFPRTVHSLIQRYRSGHLEPTWRVRLKSRGVFAQLWGTDRLLSSVDAIAIGRPPEEGDETFHDELTGGWLHIDQTPRRQGLHAYQSGVYLESADPDDWTLEVVEGSHKLFDEFYSHGSEQLKRALARGHVAARDELLDWMTERGCVRKRVPVPRGGMVLWDSRLIHANARPVEGRAHPGRWRWVVFSCMGPACWATEKSLVVKRQAYDALQMTTHWPCDDVGLMPSSLPSYAAQELHPLVELPEAARTVEAKRLVGIVPYPEAKGEEERARELSLLEQRPTWRPGCLPDSGPDTQAVGRSFKVPRFTQVVMGMALCAAALILFQSARKMLSL